MTTATAITTLILVLIVVVSYIWARLIEEDESP
jgi:ABC-type sugar transport system permease subunit